MVHRADGMLTVDAAAFDRRRSGGRPEDRWHGDKRRRLAQEPDRSCRPDESPNARHYFKMIL
jgi:hypothetical protein